MKKENKNYQIRYNTTSTSDKDRWRLIEDGNEILVSNIEVDGYSFTTKDWMENINDYKFHLTCKGVLTIKDGIAYIRTEKNENSIARHLAKTITWRIVGTIDTMILGWILTGDLKLGLAIGGTEVITKMVLYFIHERVWFNYLKIKKK